MEIKAHYFVTGSKRCVLNDDGKQGDCGVAGVGSTIERHQRNVAAAIAADSAFTLWLLDITNSPTTSNTL